MDKLLLIGLGGAFGAVCRYLAGLLPLRSSFPLSTLLINFLGAVLIGLISGLSRNGTLSERWTLFWKTGVCGGVAAGQLLSGLLVQKA